MFHKRVPHTGAQSNNRAHAQNILISTSQSTINDIHCRVVALTSDLRTSSFAIVTAHALQFAQSDKSRVVKLWRSSRSQGWLVRNEVFLGRGFCFDGKLCPLIQSRLPRYYFSLER